MLSVLSFVFPSLSNAEPPPNTYTHLPILSYQRELFTDPVRRPPLSGDVELQVLTISKPINLRPVSTTSSMEATPLAVTPSTATPPTGESTYVTTAQAVSTPSQPSLPLSVNADAAQAVALLVPPIQPDAAVDQPANELIPKPEGEPGRPNRGGYNLKSTLTKHGWTKKRFDSLKVRV